MVTKNKNVFDWMNLGLSSSQAQSISCGRGFNFLYQAKPRIKTVKPTKIGLQGSTQEKVEATPVVPESNAKTGVMQHREATIAENNPAKAVRFDVIVFLSKHKKFEAEYKKLNTVQNKTKLLDPFEYYKKN